MNYTIPGQHLREQQFNFPEKHINYSILISDSDFKNKATWRGWKQTIRCGGLNDQILK